MTREEAIQILKEGKLFRMWDTQEQDEEALRMAISALSAEPQSDDLIIKGAKGIKDGLYNIKDGELFQYKAKGGTVRAYKISSADAVQGEWIRLIEYVPESNESLINFDGYQCSVCGGKLWADGFNFWNYCPNCGAYMGEKK